MDPRVDELNLRSLYLPSRHLLRAKSIGRLVLLDLTKNISACLKVLVDQVNCDASFELFLVVSFLRLPLLVGSESPESSLAKNRPKINSQRSQEVYVAEVKNLFDEVLR